jgi:glycosyltransferase involved in cell wall biosynthesis
MRSLSFVIPVFNNAVSLRELSDRLRDALRPISDQYEVIFIDDGSTDQSWDVIKAICAEDDRVVGIHFSRNFGQHPAICAGLQRAMGEITILMDADLQDRPEELATLLEPFELRQHLDVVYTQFYLESTVKPRTTSRVFRHVFSRLSGTKQPPNVGTYRAFTKKVREALLQYPEVGAVYGPLMVQMGFEHMFVPVVRSAAVGRKTSYTFAKRLALAISVLIAYSAFFHWVVTLTGVTLTFLSSLYLAAITIQYFVADERVLANGQLLLIGITVLFSGVLLMCVGILTAYTTRIYQEVLARPRFHIAREVGPGLDKDARS